MSGRNAIKGKNEKILISIMSAIIPRGGPFKEGAADFDLVPRVNEILNSFDPGLRRIVPVFLKYVQVGSLLHKGRFFTSLSEKDGAVFLKGFEESPFFYRRSVIIVLKLLTMLVFYEDDEMASRLGYEYGKCAVNS